MKYASLCSGIGAPDLAADLLGWECQFQSEIDPFASKVLEHHFPNTPTYGDFTREINTQEWMDSIKCLVAGPPCQSFSNAGKRGGTEDARGNLSIEYLRLCREIGAKWAVFENVPGLSTRDFGHILNAGTGRTDLHRYRHWPNAGIIETGPSGYSACWRYFDAQYFGVPQRRRRLFAIFYLGSWHRPAAVLFGGEGGEGHIAPSSQQTAGVASSAGDGTEGGGGRAYGLMGNVIGRKDSNGPNGGWIQDEKAPTITCIDTPAVCYSSYGQDSRYRHFGDKTPALAAKMGTGGGNVPMVLANTGGKATVGIDVVPTITATGGQRQANSAECGATGRASRRRQARKY